MDCPSTPAAPLFAFTRLYASHTSHFEIQNGFALFTRLLPFLVDLKIKLTTQPLRSSSITEPSSLLRAAPPLCPASVLSFLWVLHLNFSLIIGTTGSHVPHKSPDQVRATFMPDAAQAVNRSPPDLSWRSGSPPVLTSSNFDTSEVVCLRSPP